MNTPKNPVGWFEIYANDLERAQKFYEGVFQVKLEELPMDGIEDAGDMRMLAFPMLEDKIGASGTICKMDGMIPGTGGTVVYFNCTDCAEEASRVESNGGQLLKPKAPIGPYGFIAIAMDTEGNCIGLHSRQ